MAKVKDLLGQQPQFQIAGFVGEAIDPNLIWARYDKEADSVVIYLTGRPQPSVSVLTDHNLYLMVDPKIRNVIGLHVENWERTFVPAHTDVKVVWEQIKQSSLSNQPWNELLRMLALWTIFILKSEKGLSPTLQPA